MAKAAAIGVSLGAAAFVLADATPPVDAVNLDSMYPTIAEAVADGLRTWRGPSADALTGLLLWRLPIRLDVDAVYDVAVGAFLGRHLQPGP